MKHPSTGDHYLLRNPGQRAKHSISLGLLNSIFDGVWCCSRIPGDVMWLWVELRCQITRLKSLAFGSSSKMLPRHVKNTYIKLVKMIHGAKTWLIYVHYVLSPRSRALSLRWLGNVQSGKAFRVHREPWTIPFWGWTIYDKIILKTWCNVLYFLRISSHRHNRADDLILMHGSIRVARTGEKKMRHTETERE